MVAARCRSGRCATQMRTWLPDAPPSTRRCAACRHPSRSMSRCFPCPATSVPAQVSELEALVCAACGRGVEAARCRDVIEDAVRRARWVQQPTAGSFAVHGRCTRELAVVVHVRLIMSFQAHEVDALVGRPASLPTPPTAAAAPPGLPSPHLPQAQGSHAAAPRLLPAALNPGGERLHALQGTKRGPAGACWAAWAARRHALRQYPMLAARHAWPAGALGLRPLPCPIACPTFFGC